MKVKKVKVKKVKYPAPRFNFFRRIYKRLHILYSLIIEKIRESLRFQLIITFGICLLASMLTISLSDSTIRKLNRRPHIDYTFGITSIDEEARNIANDINYYSENSENRERTLEEFIGDEIKHRDSNLKILITDIDGQVIYKSENASETKIDVHGIIKNAMSVRNESGLEDARKEFVSFYPVNLKNTRGYIIVSGIPEARIVYENEGNGFLSLIVGFLTFILLFLNITKKKIIYIEELAKGLHEISKGNLDYRVNKNSKDELGSLADSVNFMAKELKEKIDEEREAEKTKNELITNVSHDLRTPLTSIMGYLRLIKDKRYESNEQIDEYIDIAYGKSEKLKVLIDDLFEYTKLSTNSIKLNREGLCINELLEQLMDELIPICEENKVSFVKEIPAEKMISRVDGDKMVRVFENILMNAIKYSHKPGVVKVEMLDEGESLCVCVENKGDNIESEELSRIFDRFYRLEKSRSEATGGSGLGLAIAKNIVELHGGEIWAESEDEVISFCVRLRKDQNTL